VDLAQYGKVRGPVAKDWLHVPKRWFWHFYVVGAATTTILLLRVLSEQGWSRAGTCLAVYQVQVWRRLAECLFVQKASPGAQMHVLHYLLGVTYYLAVPGTLASLDGPVLRAQDPALLAGLALFLAGNACQHRCHVILAGLRGRGAADQSRYALPSGFLFDLVACPHYTSELVVYLGVLLLGGLDLALLLLQVFIFLELGFSAWTQDSWYRRKFPEEYPTKRRALIPMVF